MKKLYVIFLILFFCFMLIQPESGSADRTIRLKYATFMPPMMKIAVIGKEWCEEVEKRTNGRVKVTYFPGGTLVPANQAYEAAVKGITDVSMVTQQYNAGRFPLTEAMYLPLGITSAKQSTKLITAWYEKFKPKEYDDVKICYLFASGPGQFATLKPISSINDLKGLKIRCAGDSAKIVSAMGAVPVTIPLADSYEGFKRGVIAGSLLPTESLKGWKFGDLLRGLQVNDGLGYASALGVVMNKRKWNSLPNDIKKIIEEINKEFTMKTAEAWDEIDTEGIDFGKSKGMKVFKISKKEAAITAERMKPILAEYVESMKKQGLPGEESLEFCLDFVKNNP